MPARKKSAVKGPFFFFMLDFRRREEAKGKTFPEGMDQLMREAGPYWDQLGDSQREAYKDRAKAYKSSPKQNFGEKFTAQGTPYSLIEKEHQARLKKQETIRKAIAEMIQTATCNNALEKMKVYFISFNHFCKTTAQVYVPGEMAIIRYSLELGVLEKLHQFIDPGKLPLGLAYEANLLSDETHRLPNPPDAMGENDYAVLLEKLLNFTDYENKKTKLFPLFTDAKEVPMVENILSQFANESKSENTFLVCPVGEFFFQLKRATESYGLDICTFPAKTVADILLKKDTYEYTSEIACEFHEKLGNPRFCALSRVVRWSYIISDSCCLDLSIDLIAGRHLPSNADTTFLCSDFSETGSKTSLSQADRMSFVSSSDVTHLSMPKIQKIRSKSPFRGIEDDNGSIIYSSRAGTSKEVKKFDKSIVDKNISTNPFYSTDIVGVKAADMPPGVSTNYNPFSRQTKLEEVRQPREIGVVGHGRGALLGVAGPPSVVSSTVFRGAGRGSGLLSAVSSVGSISSMNFIHGEDE